MTDLQKVWDAQVDRHTRADGTVDIDGFNAESKANREKLERIDLTTFRLCYLATPYTKYKWGLNDAFQNAAKLAARLLKNGIRVYSPITHTHPIAIYGKLDPKDHSIWLPFEERMMALADCLIVAKMTGWQESFGIAHEIKFFESAGKPVFYLDTVSLDMARELGDA